MRQLARDLGMSNENTLGVMFSSYTIYTREVYSFNTLYNVMDYVATQNPAFDPPHPALADPSLIEV